MFTMPHKDSPLVAVVGCSAIKMQESAPARYFYRSPLFKAALAYAEVRTKNVVVVSGLHGAVKLDDVVAPYDFKLSNLGKNDRESWGYRAIDKMLPWYRPLSTSPPPVFLLLCGELYADALLHGIHWLNLPRPETPLAKIKGVGNRIAWLKEQRGILEANRSTT